MCCIRAARGRGSFLAVRLCARAGTDRVLTFRASRSSLSELLEDEQLYTIATLGLYVNLCRGRNMNAIRAITEKLRYVDFDSTFKALTNPNNTIDYRVREQFAALLTTIYIDIGTNSRVMDRASLIFDWADLESEQDADETRSLNGNELTFFPMLRTWIQSFLSANTAARVSIKMIPHNSFLAAVLKLVLQLVEFGYYKNADQLQKLIDVLLLVLDGREDEVDRSEKDAKRVAIKVDPTLEQIYIRAERIEGLTFEVEDEPFKPEDRLRYRLTKAAVPVMEAKRMALQIYEVIFGLQGYYRMQQFIRDFIVSHPLSAVGAVQSVRKRLSHAARCALASPP